MMISSTQPKTYILQHGAWHGGWCWKYVAAALRAQGHNVYTPTQTGLGERCHLLSDNITLDTFIDDLVNVLKWEDLNDVVLVGHSFGGLAITGAADRVPERIRHLVYLDAFILQNGQSTMSTLPDAVVEKLRASAAATSGGLSLPVPSAKAFGVTDPEQADWLQQHCTPHPISSYESPLTLQHPIGNGLPATYIALTPDYAPTTDSRTYAKNQKNWRYIEVEASHDAMITAPATLTKILQDS